MEKRSKDLLELEHKDLTSASEAALLVCNYKSKLQQLSQNPNSQQKPPTFQPLPKSQVLDRAKDFIGVFAASNKDLDLKAKENPHKYNIEAITENGSEYIEMNLMLGVADLQTPEAVATAQAAISGQRAIPLREEYDDDDDSSADSNEISDDEVEDEEKDEEEVGDDQNEMDEDGKSNFASLGSQKQKSKEKVNQRKKKRAKIVELS